MVVKTFLGWLVAAAILVVGQGAAGAGAGADAGAQSFADRDAVKRYIAELVAEHNFDPQQLATWFRSAQSRQDIIERISKPAEKVWLWRDYQKLLVDDARVAQGVAFAAEHADTLQRAAHTYGVAPEIILGILGIETKYGRITGSFPVLESLLTLGFDYPPRADFFRRELTQFLLLTREEGKDPTQLLGSYAGAMGYGQFISSSYRHYAVDFDGDGLRDIWTNPQDAIGSVANYFARHGWRGDIPVAIALTPPASALPALEALASKQLKPSISVATLRSHGIALDELADETRVSLYRLQGADGIEYWVGTDDFYVITRYNHSHMYALAVWQLAQRIRAGLDAS